MLCPNPVQARPRYMPTDQALYTRHFLIKQLLSLYQGKMNAGSLEPGNVGLGKGSLVCSFSLAPLSKVLTYIGLKRMVSELKN